MNKETVGGGLPIKKTLVRLNEHLGRRHGDAVIVCGTVATSVGTVITVLEPGPLSVANIIIGVGAVGVGIIINASKKNNSL